MRLHTPRTRRFIRGIPLILLLAFALGACNLVPSTSSPPTATPQDATLMMTEATHISPAIFASVGTGGLTDSLDALPTSVASLRDDAGRPIIFYAGAEYCPF